MSDSKKRIKLYCPACFEELTDAKYDNNWAVFKCKACRHSGYIDLKEHNAEEEDST